LYSGKLGIVERLTNEPKTALDTFLTTEEIVAFSDKIIWPAIDKLYQESFRQTASPGEDLNFHRTFIDSEVGAQTRLLISAECYSDDDSEPGTQIYEATVCLQQRQDDLTEGLLAASGKRDELEITDPEDDEDPLDGISAWHVKDFTFTEKSEETNQFDDEVLDIEEFHELVDIGGNVIWTDQTFHEHDGSKEADILSDFEADLAVTMTEHDSSRIIANLAMARLIRIN
jgi:hypothetical protein